jgi:hypothetical protein
VRFLRALLACAHTQPALTCKISMRRCAALRRPTCFEPFYTCKSVAAQRLQLSVYGRRSNRIATRTVSVHERAAQISIAHRAGHACSSSCTSGTTHLWSHCGLLVVHERGISVRLRCVCNSACDGRIAAPVDMPMQLSTRGDHRSVSASACTMRCDGRS